jgi:dihydroorotate dehydrogenase (fumarate)
MIDLQSRYLGLQLRTPLVAEASPLTGSLSDLRRLERAGAGAVVLPSLFQEQLTEEAHVLEQLAGGRFGPQAGDWSLGRLRRYNTGEVGYLFVATHLGLPSQEIETRCRNLVQHVRQQLGIPLAVKLSPYFSAMATWRCNWSTRALTGWCSSTASTSPTSAPRRSRSDRCSP